MLGALSLARLRVVVLPEAPAAGEPELGRTELLRFGVVAVPAEPEVDDPADHGPDRSAPVAGRVERGVVGGHGRDGPTAVERDRKLADGLDQAVGALGRDAAVER